MNKDFRSFDVRCNTYEYCTLATVTVPSIAPQTSGLKVFNRVLNSPNVSAQWWTKYILYRQVAQFLLVSNLDHLLRSLWCCLSTTSKVQCSHVWPPGTRASSTRTCRQIKINYSTIGGLVHIAADNGGLTPIIWATLSWKFNAILQKFFVINDVSFSVCKMHVVLL